MHCCDLPFPKSGDTSDPGNWRPIAIRDVTYTIFAKVLLGSLEPVLEAEQPSEQMGFRQWHATDDALLVLEKRKSIKWNTPI